jgi:HlyD family secretion protein
MATARKFRWSKWMLVLVALGAVVGGVMYFKNDHTDAPQYQTAPVTRGDLTQAVAASGQLNPVLNVQVGSQISGNITKLFADFNSLVKSNQVVAQLDPAIFQANVHQSEGDLANANAGLELQRVETTRSEALVKNRLISQSDYDKAIATLHQAEALVKIKEAALERSKLDLAHCTIYAPVDGIVISRSVDVGQTVAASMNAPVLFQIANDLAKMQIDANVSEADVGTVEEGQNVSFTVDAYPSRTFTGRVVQIRNSPITVQNVVTYDTVVGVTNADFKLKPGMTATVSITTAQRTNVLKIPNGALRFKPPEPSTNQTLVARWLAKVGLGKEPKTAATNTVQGAKAAGTNKVETAENTSPPPEVRARPRDLFQSGALQRSGQGDRSAGGAGSRPRSAPAWRTMYVLATNAPPGGGDPVPMPQLVRVRLGITDNSYTEVLEGLKEGDPVITAVKLPAAQAATQAPAGTSPFGGPPRFR